MASITLKNITKRYEGDVVAVHDFNLEIQDTEFVILVGPSGCGKSTTLRMIAGLEEISGGELYIGDKLVNDVPPKDRDIAMVFQNYALYPHMTVYKNMAFGLSLRKVPKEIIDQKVKEVAAILGIEELLDRRPKQLSGGQRQRVALGRAMVRDPQVFLLDEPLSNLDAKLRTQMRTEITKLHKRLGTTFVYVTHDQVEAMTMGDRIVVMKDGFIQQVDTPQNLYNSPANLFVAGFIGSPQMNFIDVTVEEEKGVFYLKFDRYRFPLHETERIKGALAPLIGKQVVLGIRPEHVFVKAPTGAADEVLAKVDLAEMMGAEALIYLDCQGVKLIVRETGETTVQDGQDVALTIDTNFAHLFHQETQEVISWR